MRCGASKSTMAHGPAASAASRARRSLPFTGRNPANTTPSKSSPLAESAAVSALAPGTGTTRSPRLRTRSTTTRPGSLTPGVPASLTSATAFPAPTASTMPRRRRGLVVRMHGDDARGDAEVREQPARDARVLGGDEVRAR